MAAIIKIKKSSSSVAPLKYDSNGSGLLESNGYGSLIIDRTKLQLGEIAYSMGEINSRQPNEIITAVRRTEEINGVNSSVFEYGDSNSVGTGLVLKVILNPTSYSVLPTFRGNDYAAGETIVIRGNDLKGITPQNDLTITIDNVDTNGGVVSYTLDGVPAAPTQFNHKVLYIGVDGEDESGFANRIAKIAGEDYTYRLDTAAGITESRKFLLIGDERNTDYLKIGYLAVDSAYISHLTSDSAYIHYLKADSADIANLFADSAFISRLSADSIVVDYLTADSAFITQLNANFINVDYLTADSAFIGQLNVNDADIDSAFINVLNVNGADIDSAFINILNVEKADIDSAFINQLNVNDADIDSAFINILNVNGADVDSAFINKLNVEGIDADSGFFNKLNVEGLDVDSGFFNKLNVEGLDVDSAFLNKLSAEGIDVDSAFINKLNAEGIDVDSAFFNKLNAEGADIDSAFIDTLSAIYAYLDNAFIDRLVVQSLTADSATINLLRATTAEIQTAIIDSAVIDHAHILGLDADSAKIDTLYTGKIVGPQVIIIDPEALDSVSGTVVIKGDLQVDGVQTIVNSTTVTINDKNIVLADSATNAIMADGAGITINGANATIEYKASPDRFEFNKVVYAPGMEADSAHFDVMSAVGAAINSLDVDSAHITYLTGESAFYVNFQADYIHVNKKLTGAIGLENVDSYAVVFADSEGSLVSTPDMVFRDFTSPHYGRFNGLSIGDVKVFDSGYYRVNINPEDGLIRAPKVRLGDERRLTPTSPVTVAQPESSNHSFVGLEIDYGDLLSTAKLNTFKSDISQAEAEITAASVTSDSIALVKITDRYDNTMIELRKDGSISFSGDLYKDGQKFKGGGVFVLDAADGDATYVVDPALKTPSVSNPFGIGGRVGVNTIDPKYNLETRGDFMVGGVFDPYSVLFNITKVPGALDYVDDSAISRFAFITSRAATRGGFYDSNVWNDVNNFGQYSVGFGNNVIGKGNYSFVTGRKSEANGLYSIAMGDSNTTGNASNIGTIAIGRSNRFDATSTSNDAVAIGYKNTSKGNYALALGYNHRIEANNAITIGTNNQITSPDGFLTTSQNTGIFGHTNRLVGAGSFIVGNNNSTRAVASFIFGTDNTAGDSFSGTNNAFALGTNNVVLGSNAGVIGTGNRLGATADYSIGIGLSGVVQDSVTHERLLSVQGGNVSIGAESDYFVNDYRGNLFVAGDIMYAGNLVRFNPATGTGINTGVFIDDGVFVTYNIGRNIGINKGDAYQSLDLLGSFIVEGNLGTEPATGWFDPNTTKTSFFAYLPDGGILRAGDDQTTDSGKVGYHSIALGKSNLASGTRSVAIGSGNEARYDDNILIGKNNRIDSNLTGNTSTSNYIFGEGNFVDSVSNGSNNVLIGKDNTVYGTSSNNVLIGRNIIASNEQSIVIIKTQDAQDSSLDATRVAVGKDSATYALDVHGSIRLDSGGQLYMGNQTIRQYLGLSEPSYNYKYSYIDSLGFVDSDQTNPPLIPQNLITNVTKSATSNTITVATNLQGFTNADPVVFNNGTISTRPYDIKTQGPANVFTVLKDDGTPYNQYDKNIDWPQIGHYAIRAVQSAIIPVPQDLTVEGNLLVKAGGLNFTVDSTGVYADGMTYDSFLIGRGVLADYFDSNYIQARVTQNEFWQRSITGDLLYYRPSSGVKPVSVGLEPSAIPSNELSTYQLHVGTLSGDGAINVKDPLLLIDPSKSKSPINLNGAAWPTVDYLNAVISDSFVTNKIKLDSATLAALVDSGYLKSVISPSYILSHANDSSEWQRRDSTLFFGTYPNVQHVRVGIGTDSPDLGIKFQVAGNVKVDSDLTVAGDLNVKKHLEVFGYDVVYGDSYTYSFNETNYQFYNTPNSKPIPSSLIGTLLSINPGATIPITFSNPINTKYFKAYIVDSVGDSHDLVKGVDYYFSNINTLQLYEASVDSFSDVYLNERNLVDPVEITGPDDNTNSLYFVQASSIVEIIDSTNTVKDTLTLGEIANVTFTGFTIIDSSNLTLGDRIHIIAGAPQSTSSADFHGTVTVHDSLVVNDTLYIENEIILQPAATARINGSLDFDSAIDWVFGPSVLDSVGTPVGRRNFRENIEFVIDSGYIGQRLTTPWQYTNIDSHVYYDKGGAVIIGRPSDLLPGDNSTKFLSIRGNAVFTHRDWDSNSGTKTLGVVPAYGAGARMMFIPQRGAFRAGAVDNITATWSDTEVGLASVGIGYNTVAYDKSIALGYEVTSGKIGIGNVVSVGRSVYNPIEEGVAVGFNIQHATGKTGNVSIGRNIVNSTNNAVTAIGNDIVARSGVAIGKDVQTSTSGSTAIGNTAQAKGTSSVAIGKNATANSSSGFAFGYNVTAGTGATAIGRSVSAAGMSSYAIGINNNTGLGGHVIGAGSYAGLGTAIGANNSVSRGNAIGIGNVSSLSGWSFGAYNNAGIGGHNFGSSNTTNQGGFAIGHANTGISYSAIAIGAYNNSNSYSAVTIGYNNDGNSRGALAIGSNNSGNSGYRGTMITVGAENTDNSAAKIFGYNNDNNYKVNIWGNSNSGSNDGFGYIFGSVNRITDGGTIFGDNNTTNAGGFVVGSYNASTNGGTIFGNNNTSNTDGFAIGTNNAVNGAAGIPFAIGDGNTASKNGYAFGIDNTVEDGFAIGVGNTSTGIRSIAIGENAIVSGTNSISIALTDSSQSVTANNILAIQGGRVAIGTNNVGAANPSIGSILDVNGRMDVVGVNGDYYRQGVRLFDYIRTEVVDRSYIRYHADSSYIKSAANFDWIHQNIDPHFYFGHNYSTNNVYYIGAGNVGIHTSTPGFDLDVNGDINLNGALYMNGNLLIPDFDSIAPSLNVTYVTEEYYIGPESAERFFDSAYIQSKQAYFDYLTTIDSDYINNRLDPDLILDSAEVNGLINVAMQDVVFTYDPLGRTEYNPSTAQAPLGPRMGIGAAADFTNTLRIAGKVTIGDNTGLTGSLDVWGGDLNIRNGNLLIDGAALTSVWKDGTYVTYNPTVPKNIGVRKNTPSYEFDVAGRINADLGVYVNGQSLLDDILDSAWVQARQKMIDSALVLELIDSTYLQGIINDSYITSIIDADYVKGIADSAYIQSAANMDWIRLNADSDYIKSAADSSWIKFNADSTYIKGIVDSTWIKFNADSTYIKGIADIEWIRLNADSNYIKSAADSSWIKFVADSNYIKSAADSSWVKQIVDSAYVKGIADSNYIQSATGIGIRNIDFGSYNIKYNNAFASVATLPNASTYQGMFATTRTEYNPYVAINGVWERLAVYNQNVTFKDVTTEDILPKSGSTYDIGSLAVPYRDLYLSGNSLYLGSKRLSVSGSEIAIDSDKIITDASLTGYIGQDVSPTADVIFNSITTTDGLVVGGNLQVNGSTTTVSAQSLMVSDNMIYMNAGAHESSPTAFIDIGFAANVNEGGTYNHVGFFRDATDGIWKIFDGYAPEPDASLQINTSDSTFNLATLQVGSIIADNLSRASGSATAGTYGSASSIPVITIDSSGFVDAITEVTVAGVTNLTYDNATRIITVTTADGDSFSATIGGVDSATVTSLIDSAYINARVVIPEVAVDSAVVYELIDSASINARVSGLDSAAISQFVDSGYILERVGNALGSAALSMLANQLQYQSYYFVADSNQSVFIGTDANGATLSYDLGTVQVYVNGLNVLNGTDYTATDGSSIIFTDAVVPGTDVVISSLKITGEVQFGFKTFKYTLNQGDTQVFGTDENGETLAYTPGNLLVHYNGILIENGLDYTATNGLIINFATEAIDGDEVSVTVATTEISPVDSTGIQEYIFKTNDTVTGNTATTIDETAHGGLFKSIEYTIHMDDSDNGHSQITKVLLTYNKTNVFMTEYGTVNSYTADSDMGTLSADENSGLIRLRFTKASGTGNVRVNPVKIVVS